MAIQDSDPERRNLTVISLAFVAYFYAAGSFPSSEVKLHVVNATFGRPWVLGVIAWIAFFWFLYRYWLTHRDQFYSQFNSEFAEWGKKPYVRKYTEDKLGIKLVPIKAENQVGEEGWIASGAKWSGGHVSIDVAQANSISRGSDGFIQGSHRRNDHRREQVLLTGFRGWVLALRASAACAFKNRSFSEYVAPYLLATVALAGPFVSSVF